MPVKIEKDNSLTISGFEGIGQSVLSDFSDIMGINTETPGVAGINFKFNKVVESLPSDTFTKAGSSLQVGGLLSSLTYRGQLNGLAVTLSSTDTLPAPFTADTIYYLSRSGTSTTIFKLSTSLKNMTDGVFVTPTDDGTGTHTITPITPGKIKHWTVNGQGRIFALDHNQRLWFGDSNGVTEPWLLVKGNTSTGDGAGLIYYKGFILVFGNGKADALTDIQNLKTTEPVWENDFLPSTISTGGDARLYFSLNDDAIYFYNGLVANKYYQIALLEQKVGEVFAPGTDSTFDLVVDVITLPYENEAKPKAINELGENIIIGTESDELYVWDKKSPSFTYFIKLQEENVNSIQVVENIAYIFMEDSASVYFTNLTSTSLLFKLPEQLTDKYYRYIQGIDMIKLNNSTVYKRELLFSVSLLETGLVYNYLYSYNIDTKILSKKNISSFGESTYQSVNYGEITSIFPFGRNIFIGSSAYNQDETSDYMDYAIESLLYQDIFYSGGASYRVYDNYEPYIITGLVSVGETYAKKTFKELQISLARALATGQGVAVSYRRDDNSSWTALKTVDFATNGAIKDIKIEAPLTDIIDLQMKINLDGVNLTSPRLKYVRLIP
jgi:hypothetical protein